MSSAAADRPVLAPVQPEGSDVAGLELRLAKLKDSIASAAIELADLESCHEVDAEHLVDQENLRRAVRRLARRLRETVRWS